MTRTSQVSNCFPFKIIIEIFIFHGITQFLLFRFTCVVLIVALILLRNLGILSVWVLEDLLLDLVQILVWALLLHRYVIEGIR